MLEFNVIQLFIFKIFVQPESTRCKARHLYPTSKGILQAPLDLEIQNGVGWKERLGSVVAENGDKKLRW